MAKRRHRTPADEYPPTPAFGHQALPEIVGGFRCPKCNSTFKAHELMDDLPSTCPLCYRIKMETDVFRECQLKPIPMAFPVESPDQRHAALAPIDPKKPPRKRVYRKSEPKKDSGEWLAKAVEETRVMPIVQEEETKGTEPGQTRATTRRRVRLQKKTPPV